MLLLPSPSPPTVPCVERYANCLESFCCTSAQDGCFRRPTRQYAQCRPLIADCTNSDEWLCPGWHLAFTPRPPPSIPLPPSPPAPSVLPPLQVEWGSDPTEPFARPGFNVSAKNGTVWIEATASFAEPLRIKGANWFGFQNDGCVNQLYRHTAQEYIDFLVNNSFNAVRLPLSAALIASDPVVASCGEYNGQHTMSVLTDLLQRLKRAGIFVMLGMHTLNAPEDNSGYWCGSSACTSETEQPLFSAWQTLAALYCSHPNVIAADLFNEPFLASWGTGITGTDWALAAARLGDHILAVCPRWLIVVQGVAQNSGQCAPNGCWWGENVQGHLTHPVQLVDQVRSRAHFLLICLPRLRSLSPLRALLFCV